MYVCLRPVWALLIALGCFSWASVAEAWVETSIRSNSVTVDVDRAGQAIVTYELLMRIRGGPLKSFELAGVDSDAKPLPDAQVNEAQSGVGGATPIPLLVESSENGQLKLEVDHERGLRRGTYLFKFSYQTELLGRDLIQAKGSAVELRWIGPRFDSGVNSAKVVFRLPQGNMAPRVPDEQSPSDHIGLSEEFDGVFLSNLSREAEKDVLDIVRPHVAKGEPVVWRVLVDRSAFDAFAADPSEEKSTLVGAEATGIARAGLWLGAALIAVLYAFLVALKAHAVSLACRARDAEARALLPLPAGLRSALAGLLLAASCVVGVLWREPTLFGLLLVAAMLAASHLGPRLSGSVRGPGAWRGIEPSWLARDIQLPLAGRFLDTGRLPGFICFIGLLGAFSGAAYWVFQSSPYFGMMLALGSACLLPIFCTGRAGELPPDPVARPRRLLSYLIKQLAKRSQVEARLIGRFPDGIDEPDELRLEITPLRPMRGLVSIEVGLEYHQTGTGPVGMPCVIVRVADDSPAYSALPRHVVWSRGRSEDERVALLRPKLPTFRMTLALVERLVHVFSRKKRPAVAGRPSVATRGVSAPQAA